MTDPKKQLRFAAVNPASLISYLLAIIAFLYYFRSGGGWLVLLIGCAGIILALIRNHIPVKAFAIGPLIVVVFFILFISRISPLLEGTEGLLVRFTRFIIMMVVSCSIFFLWFRPKNSRILGVFNCYNLLLVLAIMASENSRSGHDLLALLGMILLFLISGFFINRQAVRDRFMKKKAAGREFISGVLSGSAFVSYVLAFLLLGGILLVLAVPLYVFAVSLDTPGPAISGINGGLALDDDRQTQVSSAGYNYQDQRFKMAVEATYAGAPLNGLYMKGRDFDRYSPGGNWRVSRRNRPCPPEADGSVILPAFFNRREAAREIRLDVRLFLVETASIYAMEEPRYISRTGKPMYCRLYDYGGLAFSRLSTDLINYTVFSTDIVRPEYAMALLTHSVFPAELYNSVPDELQKVIELSRGICGAQLSIQSKINAIKEWLQENCEYDLETVYPPDVDPVEHFLFTAKRGTCVHFASSLVLMARAAGIPARYCTGYLSQFPVSSSTIERSDRSSLNQEVYYMRKRNGHAWAEIYLTGAGWATVEAVPASGLAMIDDTALDDLPAPQVNEAEDDVLTQEETDTDGVQEENVWEGVLSFIDALPVNGLSRFNLVVGLLLLAAAFMIRIPRRKYRALFERMGMVPRIITPIEFFNTAVLVLEKNGVRWKQSETAYELLIRCRAFMSAEDGAFLAEAYYRIRFGNQPADNPQRIIRILDALHTAAESEGQEFA